MTSDVLPSQTLERPPKGHAAWQLVWGGASSEIVDESSQHFMRCLEPCIARLTNAHLAPILSQEGESVVGTRPSC